MVTGRRRDSKMLLFVVCMLLTSRHMYAIYIKPELLFAGERYVVQRDELPGNSSVVDNGYGARQKYPNRVANKGADVAAYKRGVLPAQLTRYTSYDVSNNIHSDDRRSALGLTRSTHHYGYSRNMHNAYAPTEYTNGRSAYNGGKGEHFARTSDSYPSSTRVQKRYTQFRDDKVNVKLPAYSRHVRDNTNSVRFPYPYSGYTNEHSSTRVDTQYNARTRYNVHPTYNGLAAPKRYAGNSENVRRLINTRVGDNYDNHIIAHIRNIHGYRNERAYMQAAPAANSLHGEIKAHNLQKPFIVSRLEITTDRDRYSKSGRFYGSENNGKSSHLYHKKDGITQQNCSTSRNIHMTYFRMCSYFGRPGNTLTSVKHIV